MGPEPRGFFLLGTALVGAAGIAGAGILGWWLPMHHRRHAMENERKASASLRTLATAEAYFRANDGDGNGVDDFWTADVAGLYRYGGLIERSVAEADWRPLVPLVPRPIPKDGYYFCSLVWDDSQEPQEEYRQNTDGKSGKVHHLRAFGFCAFPAEPGLSGRVTYIINEGNSVFQTRPARRALSWPSDAQLKTFWSRGG